MIDRSGDIPTSSAAPTTPAGLVSVIMPMRNAEPFVRAAMESVLAQPDAPLELVVIDDGSTDGSPDVVRSLARRDGRVRMVPGPCHGIAAALNAGLAAARGEFFARCDADDFYAPDRLAGQLRFLRAHPEFGAVCGYFAHVSDKGRRISDQQWGDVPEEITQELRRGVGRTHLCTFLVRMEHLRALGGFRPYFVGTEDHDFQLRLGEACRVWYEPHLCYLYRLHGSSITHVQPTAERQFLERMAKVFQKQRLASGADDLMRGCPPPIPKDLRADAKRTDEQIQAILLGTAWREHAAGRRLRAMATGLRACRARPARWLGWRNLVALALKMPRPSKQSDASATAGAPAAAAAAAASASVSASPSAPSAPPHSTTSSRGGGAS